MAVEDLLAVYTPHSAALCRYLVARSDVASTELDNGWLVARGHLRGAGAARELPTSQPPDGLRVISGPAELLKDGPARRRFRHVLREDPSRLARFPGDFTALVLEAHGRVSFARCCSGTTPLYVASQGEHVAISTRLDWLAVSLPWSVHPDWLPIAVYAAGWAAFPDQRSPIRGITRVALGHAGSVGVNVPLRIERYWYPELLALRPRLTLPQAASELRELLIRQLNTTLRRDGSNLVLFSGGVDSACLTALAHALGYPLQGISLAPAKASMAFFRESRFLDGLAPCFSEHRRITGETPRLLQLSRDTARRFLPVSGGWAAFNAWGERPKDGCVLSGWFADECWGFHRLGDWYGSTPLRDLRQLTRRGGHPLQALRRWAGFAPIRELRPPAQLPPPFPQELSEEYRAWRVRALSMAEVPRRMRQLNICRWFSDYGGVHSEMAAVSGYLAVLPCASREVVEHAYTMPLHLCFGRRLMKLPLRHAVPELPPLYARRVDKGGWHICMRAADLPQEALHPAMKEWVDKGADASQDAPAEEVAVKAAVGSWILRWIDELEHERAKPKYD